MLLMNSIGPLLCHFSNQSLQVKWQINSWNGKKQEQIQIRDINCSQQWQDVQPHSGVTPLRIGPLLCHFSNQSLQAKWQINSWNGKSKNVFNENRVASVMAELSQR